MTRTIPHDGTERNVVASGGTLEQETTFYRDRATLTEDHTLTLPSSAGDYVFSKDSQDSIQAEMSDIESFLVGPIFHLPNDVDGSDEMKQLIEDHRVVLLVTLLEADGTDHYLHYLLD